MCTHVCVCCEKIAEKIFIMFIIMIIFHLFKLYFFFIILPLFFAFIVNKFHFYFFHKSIFKSRQFLSSFFFFILCILLLFCKFYFFLAYLKNFREKLKRTNVEIKVRKGNGLFYDMFLFFLYFIIKKFNLFKLLIAYFCD